MYQTHVFSHIYILYVPNWGFTLGITAFGRGDHLRVVVLGAELEDFSG